MHYIVLYSLLVSSCIATVYAIKCYSCESVYEPNCAEDFEHENHFKLDCSFIAPPRYLVNDLSIRNASACMKHVYRENGDTKYIRSCYFGDVNETEVGCRLDPTLTAVKSVSCHVCDNENFCNGADSCWNPLDKWKVVAVACFILTTKVFKLG